MMKISERFRKVLRMVFRGIGVSVVSLIIQACYGILPPDEPGAAYGMPAPAYGMPPEISTSISGRVRAAKTQEPIIGIHVSIEETEYWERTDKSGYFSFWIPVQDEYKLKFEDVDGPYNGGLFKEQTWKLKQNDTYSTLLISMELDTEPDEE
ncbi:MAG: carboxypeptidase-like regulatory domain-containing protein [Treponema sp.]|jgi:hypothetical protein|nr:carboxypeptidase-like regulatory domain-containing protein [Treponema sp.]